MYTPRRGSVINRNWRMDPLGRARRGTPSDDMVMHLLAMIYSFKLG